MLTAELSFVTNALIDTAIIRGLIRNLISALRMNGQICGEELLIAQREETYLAYVLLPEDISLDINLNNKYVNSHLQEFDRLGISYNTKVLESDLEESDACTCLVSSLYILYTRDDYVIPPLLCGECFDYIPLYRIPPFRNDEHFDIISWMSQYRACSFLEYPDSSIGKAALYEISSLDSDLSQNGIKICKEIQRSTDVPTYYYIYHNKDQDIQDELQRKCPGCNRDWLLAIPLDDVFDFKCDTCLLVSNISWDARNSYRNK